MKIGICSDHRGVFLKKELVEYLEHSGYKVVDYGADDPDAVDYYPEFATKLAKGILKKQVNMGISICGTGIGMSIVLNKFKGIYCAKVSSINEAVLSRDHNDANVISLRADTELEQAKIMIDKFIVTPFSNEERHVIRNQMRKDIEDNG